MFEKKKENSVIVASFSGFTLLFMLGLFSFQTHDLKHIIQQVPSVFLEESVPSDLTETEQEERNEETLLETLPETFPETLPETFSEELYLRQLEEDFFLAFHEKAELFLHWDEPEEGLPQPFALSVSLTVETHPETLEEFLENEEKSNEIFDFFAENIKPYTWEIVIWQVSDNGEPEETRDEVWEALY